MDGTGGIEVSGAPRVGSRQGMARLAGILYLAFIVVFAVSTSVEGKPIVWGDAAATAKNIASSEWMFRIGNTGEVVSTLLFLLSAWALYVLLRPVGRNLALLFLLLNLAGVAAECACIVIRAGTLELLGRPSSLHAFSPDQLHDLGMLLLKVSGSGGVVQTLFYGAWLFPLGYLVFKSGFLPRFLGVLLLLDGLCMTVCFLQLSLFPGYEKLTYPTFPIMFIAEFGLAVWLIFKGVREAEKELPAQQG